MTAYDRKGRITARVVALLILLVWGQAQAQMATLRWAFVDEAEQPLADVVVALLPEQLASASAPQAEAVVDQRDNQFVPHVSVVRTNTLVHFPNSDNVRHHVYSFSPAKRFELRLYHGTTAAPVLFDQPGRVVLGCNIHDSMLAYIYVLDTDYYTLSDAQGVAQLAVPPGRYTLEIQHPRYAEVIRQPLTLDAHSQHSDRRVLAPLASDPRTQAPASELEALFRR